MAAKHAIMDKIVIVVWGTSGSPLKFEIIKSTLLDKIAKDTDVN